MLEEIRYETAGTPFHQMNCHCSICRRTTGAPFVAWFSVPRSKFRFVQGAPTRFRSTPKGMRSFYPHCGTQLTFKHDDASDEIDVPTCSLGDPERLPPEDHTRTSSKLGWVKLADGRATEATTFKHFNCLLTRGTTVMLNARFSGPQRQAERCRCGFAASRG